MYVCMYTIGTRVIRIMSGALSVFNLYIINYNKRSLRAILLIECNSYIVAVMMVVWHVSLKKILAIMFCNIVEILFAFNDIVLYTQVCK